MKNKIKKIFNKSKFFIFEGLFLIMIELFNQILIKNEEGLALSSFKTAIIFDFEWILFFFLIICILKPKGRKIFTFVINILLFIVAIANYFLHCYFGTIFSWSDLFLTGNGLEYVSSVFKFINLNIISFIIIALIFIIIIMKINYNHIFTYSKLNVIIYTISIIFLFLIFVISKNIYLTKTNDGWDSSEVNNNGTNYYKEWVNPTKLLRICGTYEYLIKDFNESFIKKENITKSKSEVSSYIENYQKEHSNNYYGIYKDKNLLFIMMESLDDWLVNEEVTPTIYEMMQHGFNFTNHYSPSYVTGDTANTEFIANTGIYPYFNKLSPNYAYVNNSYPYSIANLFKDKGYTVNSYHRSNDSIYNRGNMHSSLGYSQYHSYVEMGIDEQNINLDQFLISDGYDKIISSDKFMSFIITFSPHSPYVYQKEECQIHLEEIKKIYPDENNEEILCAYSAAKETDEMFRLLLESLRNDNILDDTIIVAFSDHPNRLLLREDETENLNKTVYFIYDSNKSSNQINTITSSINILPTINNLFALDSSYVYPGYDPLNYNSSGYVILRDYTYYDGKSIKNLNDEMKQEVEYSKNLLLSNYYSR